MQTLKSTLSAMDFSFMWYVIRVVNSIALIALFTLFFITFFDGMQAGSDAMNAAIFITLSLTVFAIHSRQRDADLKKMIEEMQAKSTENLTTMERKQQLILSEIRSVSQRINGTGE